MWRGKRCTDAVGRSWCGDGRRHRTFSAMNFRLRRRMGSLAPAEIARALLACSLILLACSQVAHGQVSAVFDVMESAKPGECLYNISALPGTSCGQPPTTVPFSVDSQRLCIDLADGQSLDFDSPTAPRSISFQVVCVQPPPAALFIVSATVSIVDVNDNSPSFPQRVVNVSLVEGSLPGTLVTGLNALDPDSGTLGAAGIVYKLDPASNVDNTFQIIGSSGASQLVVRGTLDREGAHANYTVVVFAVDGGGRSGHLTVHVTVVDANDNAPTFVQRAYNASVREDLALHSPVLTVSAVDADEGSNADVQYSISQAGADANGSLLAVDPASGAVTSVRSPLPLGTHSFTVTATDGVGSDAVALSLTVADVNDLQPTVTRGCAHTLVFEEPGPRPGTAVCTFSVTDGDTGLNGVVNVTLINGNGAFDVDLPVTSLLPTPLAVPVRLRAPLDFESARQYHLQLRVTDNGIPPLDTVLDLLVAVNDSNEFPPRFQANGYRLTMEENTPVNTPVLTVSATDPDGSASSIAYGIESFSNFLASAWLRIDAVTGVVYTTGSGADRELLPEFNITVSAADTGLRGGVATTLRSTVTVEVDVLDANDNAPTFLATSYAGDVPENSSGGTVVTRVLATDPDDGANGTVQYSLVNADGTPSSEFSVDGAGVVSVAAGSLLDREARDVFNLTCVASDIGVGAMSSRVPVVITVLDVNDHPPVFYPAVYHCNVLENLAAGATCTTLSATDADLGSNAQVGYRIIGGNAGGSFRVDNVTGDLVTTSPLDAEVRNTYVLTVQASDAAGLLSPGNAVVNVSVLNERDQPPAFLSAAYEFSAVENATVATTLGTVTAVGQDAGTAGPITYSIAGGDPDGDFAINRTSGVVRVARRLDRERRDSYELLVGAQEAGSPPLYASVLVNVSIVDVNDNAPSFGKAADTVGVAECHPVNNASVYTANATDSDFHKAGRIRYSLLNTSDSGFDVDKLTGELTLTQSLDFERARYETVLIKAADRGKVRLTSTLTLTIRVLDCNDIAPLFAQALYTGSVNESTQPPTSVLQVAATDGDFAGNTTLTYSLLEPGKVPFMVMPRSGYVYVSQALDRETTATYRFTVVVSDGRLSNTSTVEIAVTDTNDRRPVFSRAVYTFSTPEFDFSRGVPILPALVGTVRATDGDAGTNAEVRYALATNTSDFEIDAASGNISVLGKLDRESRDSYALEVVAADLGAPPLNATCLVRVSVADVNDNAPRFLRPPPGMRAVVDVDETAAVGMALFTVVAADRDDGPNARVTFRWQGQPSALFSLNDTSGVITTIAPLDYEASQTITLSINASDGGTPPLSSFAKIDVRIRDVNDEPPVFVNTSGLTLSFVEDHPVDTELTRIVAVDRENASNGNGQVRYALGGVRRQDGADVTAVGMFSVDAVSGAIFLRRPFNFSASSRFVLEINATDSPTMGAQLTSTYALNIAVLQEKDTGPYFPKPVSTVDVLENVTMGTRFLRVTALNRDAGASSKLEYQILSQAADQQTGAPSALNHFSIDNSTGWLTVLLPLDFEAVRRFSLVIQATDNSLSGKSKRSANASLTVQVVNLNEHSPVFPPDQNLKLFEDERLDRVVFTATAQDQDDGAFGQIAYAFHLDDGSLALQDGPFSMNDTTGQVWLKSGLDYEKRRAYVWRIRGSDTLGDPSGKSSELVVNVTVLDVNDNPPRFMYSSYVVVVNESEPVDTLLTTVRATDSDSGSNGHVTYRLADGEGKFKIDAASGALSTTAVLDRDNGREHYTLTVIASDTGSPVLTSSVDVSVNVEDVNDCAPRFFVPSASRQIQENTPIATIETLLVMDCDKGSNARLSYSIIGGNEGGEFAISPKGGVFVVQSPLDRENKTFYQIVIEVCDSPSDPRAQLCGQAYFNITVTDDNDNTPRFNRSAYSGAVREDAPIGRSVLQVSATDADSVQYGLVHYEMTDPTGHFAINASSGVISVAKELDHEDLSVYTLTVEAADNDPHGARRAAVPVTIAILDVNDFTPTFARSAYAVNVSAAIVVGASVFNMTAFDIDSGENGRIEYILSAPSADFAVARATGLVTTRRALSVASSPYLLPVLARDSGTPSLNSTVDLTVAVLAASLSPPRFLEDLLVVLYQVGTIRANDEVARVAAVTDDPSASLTYSVAATTPSTYATSFAVDAGSGTLRAVRDLTLTASNRVQVLCRAVNAATGASATTTVQLQRDLLQHTFLYFISPPLALVPETAGTGTLVLTAVAKSAFKQSQPRYSIISGNSQHVFVIDRQSGQIRTRLPLDFEGTSSYTISVMAEDAANFSRPAIAAVQIDVGNANDNPPVWHLLPQGAVVIPENWPPHTYLTTVQATDRDMSPLYYGIANQPATLFDISQKGEIKLGSLGVDYETSASYLLNVTCSDGVKTIYTTVVIRISDVNDNAPVFFPKKLSKVVAENEQPGLLVATVRATDADSGANSRISYVLLNDINGSLAINGTSGEVRLLHTIPFQRQHANKYFVTVLARDMGKPSLNSTLILMLDILDVNDHSPVFSQASYVFNISESTPTQNKIGTVHATDDDSQKNALLAYNIVGGSKYFSVSQGTGDIYLLRTVDREVASVFRLNVSVSDDGSVQHVTYAPVLVNILDANDNGPRFDQSEYTVGMPIDQPFNVEVARVHATDADEGSNAAIFYSIRSGNDFNIFHLDFATGSLFLHRDPSDQIGLGQSVTLTIQATDGVFQAFTRLVIVIFASNQTGHVFTLPLYDVSVAENARRHKPLVQVQALRPKPGGAPITYYFATNATQAVRDTFALNATTGWLTVRDANVLDYEQRASYEFWVQARDPGSGETTAYARVRVTVLNANEYKPLFGRRSYAFDVALSSAPGTVVGTVVASDDDKDAVVRYYFNEVNRTAIESGLLVIDVNVGTISVGRDASQEEARVLDATILAFDGSATGRTNATFRLADPAGAASSAASGSTVLIAAVVVVVLLVLIVVVVVIAVLRKRSEHHKSLSRVDSNFGYTQSAAAAAAGPTRKDSTRALLNSTSSGMTSGEHGSDSPPGGGLPPGMAAEEIALQRINSGTNSTYLPGGNGSAYPGGGAYGLHGYGGGIGGGIAAGGLMGHHAHHQQQLQDFGEEGAGEAWGGLGGGGAMDMNTMIFSRLAEIEADEHEAIMDGVRAFNADAVSYAGSIGSVARFMDEICAGGGSGKPSPNLRQLARELSALGATKPVPSPRTPAKSSAAAAATTTAAAGSARQASGGRGEPAAAVSPTWSSSQPSEVSPQPPRDTDGDDRHLHMSMSDLGAPEELTLSPMTSPSKGYWSTGSDEHSKSETTAMAETRVPKNDEQLEQRQDALDQMIDFGDEEEEEEQEENVDDRSVVTEDMTDEMRFSDYECEDV